MNTLFKGSGVALVTPFNENGINYEALSNLIEFQIQNGTDAIIIAGTTGEPATMTKEEKTELIRFAIEKINKRVPAIVGTGSFNTQSAIENSKEAERLGADGLLVVTPYYNKCTQNGLISYYNAIADSVNIPIIAYSVKGRTGVNIEPKTMLEIAKNKNIVGLKEASGNFSQILEMFHLLKGKIDIYSGDDSLATSMAMLGSSGVISVAANIVPNEMHTLMKDCFDKNFDKALSLNDKLFDIFKNLFIEVNPIPVKYALNEMGFNVGSLRAPLSELEDQNKAIVKQTIDKYISNK